MAMLADSTIPRDLRMLAPFVPGAAGRSTGRRNRHTQRWCNACSRNGPVHPSTVAAPQHAGGSLGVHCLANVLYCFAMQSPEQELGRFLEALADEARPGDRLPPIREVMRRFGASPVLVQRAFHDLKTRGLIESEVGRGTYFRGQDAAPPAPPEGGAGMAPRTRAAATRSVLLLRRSISIARGRVLVEGLHHRFASEGHPVLEVSYTDSEHARTVLKA